MNIETPGVNEKQRTVIRYFTLNATHLVQPSDFFTIQKLKDIVKMSSVQAGI